MLATWGTHSDLLLNLFWTCCVFRDSIFVSEKCCTWCLLRYLSVSGCHSSHSLYRRTQALVGNAANRVLASVMWGEDVETTADLSTKPSISPLPGDRPSQANYCAQHSRGARLGRKRAVEEAFPTVLRCILLREGSLSGTEEHHGNRGQVPPSHLLIQTSPRESTL